MDSNVGITNKLNNTMSREQKKRKLGNAIREYRGINNGQEGDKLQWYQAPKFKKVETIRKWLAELKLNFNDCISKIDGFKSFDEFYAWMKSI